jgi:hypothetical protein
MNRLLEVEIMSMHNTFVATYAQPRLAEIDLEKMQNAGFDLRKLRIVTQDPYRIAERRRFAPLLDSFKALDPEFSSCIPEKDIADFEAELETGHLFIVAHGLPDEIEQAKRIADSTHPSSWDGQADASIYYGCMD